MKTEEGEKNLFQASRFKMEIYCSGRVPSKQFVNASSEPALGAEAVSG